MNIVAESYKLLQAFYSAANVPLGLIDIVQVPRYRSVTRDNRRFEDIHRGKRCFVIGGGPSLKEVDLVQLKDEITFFVNRTYLMSEYESIAPSYHCAIDPVMYGVHRDEFERVIRCSNDTHFFVSRKAIDFFGSYENVSFVRYGRLPSGRLASLDISKSCCAFVNIVPFAIQCALYTGCSRIVLLGCDFSQFASRIDRHGYGVGEEAMREGPLWQDLLGHAIAVMQHEFLKDYALLRGVEIVNATEDSFLDTYPRVELAQELSLDC